MSEDRVFPVDEHAAMVLRRIDRLQDGEPLADEVKEAYQWFRTKVPSGDVDHNRAMMIFLMSEIIELRKAVRMLMPLGRPLPGIVEELDSEMRDKRLSGTEGKYEAPVSPIDSYWRDEPEAPELVRLQPVEVEFDGKVHQGTITKLIAGGRKAHVHILEDEKEYRIFKVADIRAVQVTPV